jgi:N-acyl-D-aspartate/D-glutamate deacylase
MRALLRKSLEEGGCGFSTTDSASHMDHEGNPVPSRWATDDEYLALAAELRDFPGTWLELLPPWDPERRITLPTQLSLTAQRTLNWNVVVVRAQNPEMVEAQLELGRHAARNGARVLGLVPAAPIKSIVNFRTGALLEMLPEWPAFLLLPHDEKLAAMKDPEVRRKLRAAVEGYDMVGVVPKDLGICLIEQLHSENNARWVGRTVREYAEETGKDPFDALFDLAIEEDLGLSFSPPGIGDDEASWALKREVLKDPNALIGASDAGAHVDQINTFAITTQLMGEAVRERGMFTLEEGVRRITSHLADTFGLTGRGRIAVGAAADLVVFDPETIGCGPMEMRHDLPGGEVRLYAESLGVEHVIVNGIPVARGNAPTGRIGGKVLRSGRDTHTVALG